MEKEKSCPIKVEIYLFGNDGRDLGHFDCRSEEYSNWINDPVCDEMFNDGGNAELYRGGITPYSPFTNSDSLFESVKKIIERDDWEYNHTDHHLGDY